MEEWKEYKLGTLTDRKIGYGIVQPGASVSGGVPVIKVNNIISGLRNVEELETTSKANDAKYSRTKLIGGELIISVVGTIGKTAIVPMSFAGCNLVRATCLIDIKDKQLVSWVKYYIDSPQGQRYIHENLNTTVQPTLNVKSLVDMPIPMYSSEYMKKAVSILKSLDDKIELNKRINENLEQQAQALFKSWFVDFEPFKNGEFIESELGMIPKGWRVGRYEEIIETTISGDWGKEKPEGNYTHKVACIRGCDFQDIKNGLRGKTPERYILEKNFQTKHFKDKDVLVEISGGTATVSTGRVCPVSQLLIDKFNEDIVCTNFCRLVRPKPSYGAYLYYSWLYKFNNKVMFGYENGTSGIKNFRIKDFTSLEPIVIPSESSLQLFQSMIDKLQMKLQMNGSESQKLASLRDTLLPKLMSGELKVNEIENRL